jgi:hypothetical protein
MKNPALTGGVSLKLKLRLTRLLLALAPCSRLSYPVRGISIGRTWILISLSNRLSTQNVFL